MGTGATTASGPVNSAHTTSDGTVPTVRRMPSVKRQLSAQMPPITSAWRANKRQLSGGSSQQTQKPSASNLFAAVSLQALVKKRKKFLRSKRERLARLLFSWLIVVGLHVTFIFLSLIYALKFGEATMKVIVMGWVIGYGMMAVMIEPIQAFLLACCPCMFNEETRIGRCCERVRFCYNELLAP